MLVGYARVSTQGQSADLQIDALVAAGIDPRHIYRDKATGSTSDRPGLVKALAYLSPGDTLIIWKLDRLARSLAHLIAIVADLKERGIHLRSLTEGIDTTTSHGALVLHIFGVLGEFERALIQERVNAGLAAAAKRGRKGGRPRVISDEKLAYIMLDLNNHMSKAEICRKYGVDRSTLNAALKRPIDLPAIPSETVDIEELI